MSYALPGGLLTRNGSGSVIRHAIGNGRDDSYKNGAACQRSKSLSNRRKAQRKHKVQRRNKTL